MLTSSIPHFFSQLTKVEQEKLLEISEFKSFNNKSIILKSGNKSKKAFLILEGSVRGFVISNEGEEKTILLRSKGIFVADAETLFGNQTQKITMVSMDKTKVLLFSLAPFEKLANNYRGIQSLYTSSLKEAILRLTYRVHSMITMSSEQRYLDLLEKNPTFLKDTYDKHIANYLGITAVSFSRIKKKINQQLNK